MQQTTRTKNLHQKSKRQSVAKERKEPKLLKLAGRATHTNARIQLVADKMLRCTA